MGRVNCTFAWFASRATFREAMQRTVHGAYFEPDVLESKYY